MPLTAPVITSAILAAGPGLTGVVWPRLVSVIASAIVVWAPIPANLTLTGVTTGTVGSGMVNGKVFVAPTALPVSGAFLAADIAGVNATRIAQALGIGVANAFTLSAQYQGTSVGVGVGSDVSKVTLTNGPFLTAAIVAAATAQGIVGPFIGRLSVGIGNGIAALLLSGTGVGVVTGPTGPSAAAGTSLSRIF